MSSYANYYRGRPSTAAAAADQLRGNGQLGTGFTGLGTQTFPETGTMSFAARQSPGLGTSSQLLHAVGPVGTRPGDQPAQKPPFIPRSLYGNGGRIALPMPSLQEFEQWRDRGGPRGQNQGKTFQDYMEYRRQIAAPISSGTRMTTTGPTNLKQLYHGAGDNYFGGQRPAVPQYKSMHPSHL
ncbi:MAG: hypothetical protein AAGB04_00055 [Pseudomonadota bacterium]